MAVDIYKTRSGEHSLLRQAMQNGSAGKNDLARLTHLSFPTVSRIVDEMVECGEAQEIGTAASTGGRCAMQYRLNPQYRLFLCLRLEQDTLHWLWPNCDLDGTARTGRPAPAVNFSTFTYPRQRWYSALPERCITASCIGYPRRCAKVRIFVIKPACRVWRLAICRSLANAAQYPPTPAVVCIYIPASWAQAQVSCWTEKVWAVPQAFAGEFSLPIKHNLEYAQNHFAGADMSDTISPKVIWLCGAHQSGQGGAVR